MALISCPECDNQISEFAESCPDCGYILAPGEAAEIKEREAQEREQEAWEARMARIACPECEEQIIESAESCPNCGYILAPGEAVEIKEQEARDKKNCRRSCILWTFSFIVMFICFVFWLASAMEGCGA